MSFQLIHTDKNTSARAGVLTTSRGQIQTPVFMPVGTQATVKSMSPEELEEIGIQIILSNTFHLFWRPGPELIKKAGGLHSFMHWKGPILTDSGGYQIFSLAPLCKLEERGVSFKSLIDGSTVFLSPEMAVQIQLEFGVDIITVLDECLPYPSSLGRVRESVELTLNWARRGRRIFLARRNNQQLLFGIVQGSTYIEVRRDCAERLTDIGFDGYALGGISVGEAKTLVFEIVEATVAFLPREKPRYLMGVGTPLDILQAVEKGVDMFDCAIPTRNARNGTVYTYGGKLCLKNASFIDDFQPIEKGCSCYACRNFSRAYIRHLFKGGEILAMRLATWHNLHFYTRLLSDARQAISEDKFSGFLKEFKRNYQP